MWFAPVLGRVPNPGNFLKDDKPSGFAGWAPFRTGRLSRVPEEGEVDSRVLLLSGVGSTPDSGLGLKVAYPMGILPGGLPFAGTGSSVVEAVIRGL